MSRVLPLLSENPSLDGFTVEGRYEIRARIGRGGMGEVFQAWDMKLNRSVAMKVLSGEVSNTEMEERFRNESTTLARIEHPGIVPIHDFGVLSDGRMFYTMKQVIGRTLDELMHEKTPCDRLIPILAKVCDIIQYAHERGVIHRDLKPGNIMVDERGGVFVVDWGLARVIQDGGSGQDRPTPTDKTIARLTIPGMILGTPAYMAPEQAKGDIVRVDKKSDIYSLGAILYEVLTGDLPVTGSTLQELLQAAKEASPEPPRKRDTSISVELEAVCLKALARNPKDRFPSMSSLAEALANSPIVALSPRKRSPWLKFVGAIVVASLAGGGWIAVREFRSTGSPQETAAGDGKKNGGAAQPGEVEKPRENGKKSGELLKEARRELDQAIGMQYAKKPEILDFIEQVERGKKLAQEVSERFPDLAEGHYLHGRAWELRGNHERAEECWQKAIARDSHLALAHYRLGRLWTIRSWVISGWSSKEQKNGISRRAESWKKEAQRLRTAAETQIDLAIRQSGRFEERERLLADAILAYLQDNQDLFLKTTQRGINEFAGKRGVEEFQWFAALGSSQKDALQALDRAISFRPMFAWAFFARGNLQSEAGEFHKATVDYSQAILVEPDFWEAFFNRAQVSSIRKRWRNAVSDFTAVIHARPENISAFHYRGRVHLEWSKWKEAVIDFTKAIDLEKAIYPDADPWIHTDRGSARFGMRYYRSAIANHTEALRLKPTFAEAYYRRGLAKYEKLNTQGAIADQTEAIRLKKTFPEAYYQRGYVYQSLKNWQAAIDDYMRALEIAPADWPLRKRVGIRLTTVQKALKKESD